MSDNIEEMQAAIESLSAKNKELIGELRTAKAKAKGADIDPDDYAKLQSEVDELRSTLEKTTKTSKAELEKLTKERDALTGDLSAVLVDGGLNSALAKSGVKPEFMDAAAALLRSQVKLNGRDALMGDKPLAEAVAAWVAGDTGKHFASAPASTGGGATGGNGTNAQPKGNLGGDKTQRTNAISARFPELAANR